MKTPEEWINECGTLDFDGMPKQPIIFADDILAIQRDAYRQGLVDAAKAMCYLCRDGVAMHESLGACHTSDLPNWGAICTSRPLWELIEAHDKEAGNGTETK